jgi:hypothetical protein
MNGSFKLFTEGELHLSEKVSHDKISKATIIQSQKVGFPPECELLVKHQILFMACDENVLFAAIHRTKLREISNDWRYPSAADGSWTILKGGRSARQRKSRGADTTPKVTST